MKEVADDLARTVCSNIFGDWDECDQWQQQACLDVVPAVLGCLRDLPLAAYNTAKSVPVSDRGHDHLGKDRPGMEIGMLAAVDAWEATIDRLLEAE